MGDNRYHSIFGTAALESYPCASYCPAGTAIPSYLERVKKGNYAEAAKIFVEYNPMPAMTGRVCPTYCEPECKRGDYDEPVAIRCVERSLGDYLLDHPAEGYGAPKSESGNKVAIIGSGPAGLAAAYYLRRAGHKVTVFEKLPEAGGMLRYAIPPYRLPNDLVQKQVAALEGMGITFELGKTVTKEMIEDLKKGYDAVLVTTGAWKEKAQAIKGNGKIHSGLIFLKRANEGDTGVPGKKVAVVGGGNVAIDVARTLVRLGAKPVVIYRRTQKEMPAFADEVEKAREEGVSFQFLTLPTEAQKAGEKVGLTCIKMKLGAADESGRRRPVPKEGSEFTTTFDAVIRATGEEPDPAVLPAGARRKAGKDNPGHLLGGNLYFAGDFKTGSSTVIEAVASGREAASAIEDAFSRNDETDGTAPLKPGFPSAAYEPSERIKIACAPVATRLQGIIGEDTPGATPAEAEKEASRCFNCGCLAVNPSDLAVALVAAGGRIVTSRRIIDSSAFFAPDATNSTILGTDEMITEIRIPRMPDGARGHYLKFTLRKPIDFAIVSAVGIFAEKNGKCIEARIALGAVAPAPVRLLAVEAKLKGKKITESLAAEAAEAAVEGVTPLSKNAYKVQIAKALVRRAIMGEKE
jgi:NADPH-dependent glutamate synthase beta subunit-like oxidoreductase